MYQLVYETQDLRQTHKKGTEQEKHSYLSEILFNNKLSPKIRN